MLLMCISDIYNIPPMYHFVKGFLKKYLKICKITKMYQKMLDNHKFLVI